ncbi:MAG TPA: dihydropteroate synthase [Gaiellales bacterium]|nr:dihydropteroate synthase [Gaiellales bacterium]
MAADGLLERFPRPAVMGVLNVTPDSFSDGGEHLEVAAAVARGTLLAAEGADLIDVGGESTRPGSEPVTAAEELRRVMPVIERLAGAVDTPISIDTMKAEVAEAAIAAGAAFVNDVTAFGHDPRMADVVASTGVGVCLMHMRGEPRTMQDHPHYDDVVAEVASHLRERAGWAVAAGIRPELVAVDPGIGFGKTTAHNLALLRGLPAIAALGHPVLVGVSRKRFLGELTGEPIAGRGTATVAANLEAFRRGAWMFRVHDVRDTSQALLISTAVEPG